jgi:hypothetical protein
VGNVAKSSGVDVTTAGTVLAFLIFFSVLLLYNYYSRFAISGLPKYMWLKSHKKAPKTGANLCCFYATFFVNTLIVI